MPFAEVIGTYIVGALEKVLGVVERWAPRIQGLFGRVVEVTTGLFTGLQVDSESIFGEILGTIGDILGSLVDIVTEFAEFLLLLWEEFGEDLMERTRVLWDTIWGVISGVLDMTHGLLEAFMGLVTGDWERFGEGLQTVWQGAWDAIGSLVTGARDLLVSVFTSIRDRLSAIWQGLWEGLADVVRGPVNVVVGLINGLLSGIEVGINTVIAGINVFINGINRAITALNRVPGVNLPQVGELADVSLARVPKMDTGGLVEGPGLFEVGPGVREIVRTPDLDRMKGISPVREERPSETHIEVNATYYVDSQATAKTANEDLLRKLRVRGVKRA